MDVKDKKIEIARGQEIGTSKILGKLAQGDRKRVKAVGDKNKWDHPGPPGWQGRDYHPVNTQVKRKGRVLNGPS